MDKFFKRNFDTSSAADPEEVQMLRQKIGTMEEVVKRTEDELRHERENFTSLQAKVEMWKGKVKDKTAKDQERIAQLEDELKVMRTLRESTDASMTADIQSLVDKSLLTLRDKHTQQLQTKQQELSMARKTISERESENASIRSEMETLQQQYIEIQQRFAQEIESLSRHHEKEVEQLNESLRGLERVHELEKEIAKREDEIRTLESHSNQQALLFGELQRENAEFKAGNNELQEKLKEALNKLTVLQDKQQTWKEAVKNMKVQDEKLIHELREDLEKQRRATSADSGLNPSQEEKLLQWKEKVKNEKLKDLEKIKNLTSELNTSKLQMGKAQKLISNIAMLLAEDPPSVANTINAVNKYVASMEDESTEIFQTPSLGSFPSSVFTTQKNQEEPLDKPPALPDQHIQLSEAVRQRDEVQQELQRTSEELASIREASGAETVSLQAQLNEAVRQREGLDEECVRLRGRVEELRKECEAVEEKKVNEIRGVEEKLLLWKEKVLATKANDDARIASLDALVSSLRDDVKRLVGCFLELLAVGGELVAKKPLAEGDGEVDVSCVLSIVDNFKCRLAESMNSVSNGKETGSLPEVLLSLDAKVATAQMERNEVSAALQHCQQELETAKSRLSEAETNLNSSASPELLAELEMKNSHLEEKCELLRKEMKRQRDAFQRERAQRGLSLSSAMREDGDAARSVASGGVFEKDMLSLANQQSQRDSEIRQLRSQLHALEKENAVLKRECDYNNGLVAQYTKDIEVLKGKERIQQSMEYVRNVILQFLCCSSEEIRVRMVPVIATVLEFSPKEKLDVQRAIPSCPRLD